MKTSEIIVQQEYGYGQYEGQLLYKVLVLETGIPMPVGQWSNHKQKIGVLVRFLPSGDERLVTARNVRMPWAEWEQKLATLRSKQQKLDEQRAAVDRIVEVLQTRGIHAWRSSQGGDTVLVLRSHEATKLYDILMEG